MAAPMTYIALLGLLLVSLGQPAAAIAAARGGDGNAFAAAATTAPAWLDAAAIEMCANAAARPARPLLILADPSAPPPRRRADSEPAVKLVAGADDATLAAPRMAVSLANRLLLTAEVTTLAGRRVFPITVSFEDVRTALAAAAAARCGAEAAAAPFAVFDASLGRVAVDASALAPLSAVLGVPEQAAAALRLVEAVADGVMAASKQVLAAAAQGAPASVTMPALAAAAAAAVPAALAAAGGGALVVFCIVCVAALGIAAPLAINYVICGAAEMVCERLSLDANTCMDLWVGALGVAMVLSLLSAVPIFKMCRLAECAAGSGGGGSARSSRVQQM